MAQFRHLSEAMAADRFNTAIKNLGVTIDTVNDLLKSGVAPTEDQLVALWKAHENLGSAYDSAERNRASKEQT